MRRMFLKDQWMDFYCVVYMYQGKKDDVWENRVWCTCQDLYWKLYMPQAWYLDPEFCSLWHPARGAVIRFTSSASSVTTCVPTVKSDQEDRKLAGLPDPHPLRLLYLLFH